MSPNTINEDLRTVKVEKALRAAMLSLLRNQNFGKITVKGICEEALVSRATFYAHFADKYALLRHWMAEILMKYFCYKDAYEQIEKVVNCRMRENLSVLKNLVDDADSETFDILFDCILSTINLNSEKGNSEETSPRRIVLSNFYAGGIISYLSWQVKNRFPLDVPPMNRYLYEMIHELQDWQSE